MSKRSSVKRMESANHALRFFREQMKISQLEAAKRSGLSGSMIAHLEQGRIDLRDQHLEKLLPVLGISRGVFDAFASGQTPVPKDLRRECLELIKAMSIGQLQTAHGVLVSLAGQIRKENLNV
ncbi:MAG: helix-turn-helix transcriptional regulator [Oligoflexia bacterium]|nr:helix-turn-helix transcriptional regulator [Oligoflexia bacterium]